MSKTFNRKGKVFKEIENETIEQASDIGIRFSRHPDAHKNKSLQKEFKHITKNKMQSWRFRFGERDEKSDRLKRIRKTGGKSRRNALKKITKTIIDEETN